MPRGVGSGEPCGVTCDTGGGVAEELEYIWTCFDLKTDGGKLKMGLGEKTGDGDGEGERGVWIGRDFIV